MYRLYVKLISQYIVNRYVLLVIIIIYRQFFKKFYAKPFAFSE